jgi:hypothetical protein
LRSKAHKLPPSVIGRLIFKLWQSGKLNH